MGVVTIEFNGNTYVAVYNEQSGYYEVEITAPNVGGVYQTNITYTADAEILTGYKEIQVLAREPVKIINDKSFIWIFDYKDLSVKGWAEIQDYEIVIDEETNATSTIRVLKDLNASSRDYIVFKRNNEKMYWRTNSRGIQ